MGSVFPLDLILFLTLIFSNPSDASETRHRICFPTGDHPVDSATECPDASVSTEPRQQQQQQQQQPTATTTC